MAGPRRHGLKPRKNQLKSQQGKQGVFQNRDHGGGGEVGSKRPNNPL